MRRNYGEHRKKIVTQTCIQLRQYEMKWCSTPTRIQLKFSPTISPTPTTVCQFKDWKDRIIEIKIHIIKRFVALPIRKWDFRWKKWTHSTSKLMCVYAKFKRLNFNVFILDFYSYSFQRKYLFSFQPSPQLKTGRRI